MEPKVFSELPKLDPTSSSLSKEEGTIAVKELVKKEFVNLKFPKVQRLNIDPPIPGNQVFCLHTFIPSSGAKPDNDGIYGLMKCRGTFHSLQDADNWCENLIRNVDSTSEITVAWPGKYFPVTTSDKFSKVDEIDLRKQMTDVVKSDMKDKKEKEMQEINEIEQRKKFLMEKTEDIKENSLNDLEMYTTLRTKRATLRQYQEELEKKLKEIGKLIKEHTNQINEIDDKNPKFKNQYKEKYLKSINEVGATEATNPLMKYM